MTEFGTVQWVQEASHEEWKEMLGHLQKRINRVLMTEDSFWDGNIDESIREDLNDAIKLLEKLDPARNSAKLHNLVFVHIVNMMKLVSKYDTFRAGKIASIVAWRKARRCYYKVANHVKKVDNKKELHVFADFLPAQKAITSTQMTPFETVNTRIKEMKVVLDQLSSVSLTTEDEYLLSEIKNSYIPHIVKAASELKMSSAINTTEVEKHFLTQLELVQKQLQELVDRKVTDTFNDVLTQTQFLSEKFEERKGMTV